MEYKITIGDYGSESYEVIKVFRSKIWATRYVQVLGYKGAIHNGCQFSYFGTTYTIHIN